MSSGSGDSVDDDDEEPQPLKPAQMEAVAVEIDSKLAVVFAAADCCCLDDSPLLLYCWVKCSMTKHSKMMTMTLFGWRQSAMPDWSGAAGTSTSARRRRRADPAAGSTHWRKEALQRLPLMLELKMTPKKPKKPQLKWMSPKKKRRTLLLLLATECPPLSPLKDRRKCKRRKEKEKQNKAVSQCECEEREEECTPIIIIIKLKE